MRAFIMLALIFTLLVSSGCSTPLFLFQSDRDGDEEIYIMDSNGNILAQLTNNTDDEWFPAFSADGTKITFTSDRHGNAEIYIMNSDGTNPTRMTNHPNQDLEPQFSPDGSSIVFWSDQDAVSIGNFDIYLLEVSTSTVTRLTDVRSTSNTTQNRSPVFSPDGSKIAFESFRNSNYDIYIMDHDGSNEQQLTTHSASDQTPAFSPDGQSIVFASARDLNFEIYTVRIDGSGLTRITTTPDFEANPSFNWDGTRIIYEAWIDMSDNEIFIMNADGSGPVNMTNHPADDYCPMFIP